MRKALFILIIVMLFSYQPKRMPTTTLESHKMYLTFDDGPNQYTLDILNILDEFNIKATFFVTGENEDYYDVLKEIDKRGHTIGLHCFKHDYDVIYKDEESYVEDLNKISSLVESYIGRKVTYLRFPGGTSNKVSAVDMHDLIDVVEHLGYTYFDWNGEIGDAKKGYSFASVFASSMSGVDGSKDIMLLCHDKEVTKEILGMLIEYYLEMDYEFYAIDDSTPSFSHLRN